MTTTAVVDVISSVAKSLRCDCFYPDEHAEFGSEPCAKHRLLNLLDSILDMEPPR